MHAHGVRSASCLRTSSLADFSTTGNVFVRAGIGPRAYSGEVAEDALLSLPKYLSLTRMLLKLANAL